MSYSMSQAALPSFEISLNALSAILDKAAAYAAAKKIDPQCFFIRVCSRTCSISLVRCRWRRITLRTALRASRALSRPATKIMRRPSINSRPDWQKR